jgi:CBS domain-containing protein
MYLVSDILNEKGNNVWTVSPDTPLLEALQRLAEKNVGALLVTEGDQIAGILSERDVVRMIARKGACPLDLPVRELMVREVITVTPRQSLDDCMKLMTEKRIRHLPVLEEGRLVGLVSIGDVVRWVIDDQLHKIHDLEGYITGSYGR